MNVTEAREELAAAVEAVVAGRDVPVTVYPSAIDGVGRWPAVVLGMPSWRSGPTFGLDQLEFPVAVIVARPGLSDDKATVKQLDELWPVVLDGLRSWSGDLDFNVSRAEFGQFALQGGVSPAQIITCTFTQ